MDTVTKPARKPRIVKVGPHTIETQDAVSNEFKPWKLPNKPDSFDDTNAALKFLRDNGTSGTYRIIQVKRTVTVESATTVKNIIK